MDLQEYLNIIGQAARNKTLTHSDQLTLGRLISKIEPIANNQKEVIGLHKHEAEVIYDFGYLYPTSIDSWRGAYDELALNYVDEESAHGSKPLSVSEFLKMLKEAIGKEFYGWKGGEYTMNENTPIWVANPGNVGSTAVIDVVNNNYQVILITGLREY